MVGRAAAFHTYRMYFLYLFCYSHKSRHRAERLAHEVCVKTGHNDSYASVGKSLHYFNESVVKELCLVNSYYFNIT